MKYGAKIGKSNIFAVKMMAGNVEFHGDVIVAVVFNQPTIPAGWILSPDAERWPSVGSSSGQRLWRWPGAEPTLGQFPLSAGIRAPTIPVKLLVYHRLHIKSDNLQIPQPRRHGDVLSTPGGYTVRYMWLRCDRFETKGSYNYVTLQEPVMTLWIQ